MMNYKKKIYLYFFATFIIYTLLNIIILTNKDKRNRTANKCTELSVYCNVLENFIASYTDSINGTQQISSNVFEEAKQYLPSNYRFTFIDNNGKVMYDNAITDLQSITDHNNRPEIVDALESGSGSDIRESSTNGVDYLYYATRTKQGNYIRIAMPFAVKLSDSFHADSIILYTSLGLFFLVLVWMLYQSDKFGSVMKILKKFASDAEEGQVDYTTVKFPDTDSGEIGSKIISLYKQLEDSKKQTYLEKDKNRQMKQTMTSNIAHELKTPVCSIRGYLETVLTTPDIANDKRNQFLEHAYSQTLRLTELIDDVTMLNKIEDASSLFVKDQVTLCEVFNEVYEESIEDLNAHSMTVKNSIDPSIIVSGNHTLIHAIFRNLVENSIKYAGDRARIQIESTGEDKSFVNIRYFDTGIGVAEKYLETIFDRFVRIDEGRTRKAGGSGLGLAIVKHAIFFHGGKINASLHEGGGLQFDFSLRKKY